MKEQQSPELKLEETSTIQSKYQFTELPDGFCVEAPNRNPVTVRLESTCFTMYTCGDPNPTGEFSLFEYYLLSLNVANGLMAYWEPPAREGQDHTPKWLRKWAVTQTAGAIGKRVYSQWQRLLAKVDPSIVAVQKALFAATGGKLYALSELWRNPDLYRDDWLVRDITHHRAAALAVANIDTLLHQRERYQRTQAMELLRSLPETAALNEVARAMGLKIELDAQPYPTPDPLIAIRDWRALYAPTGKPYRSLNRTLMNLPGGVPPSLVANLALTILPRPITDRVELTVALAYIGMQRNPDNDGVILNARRAQILEAIWRVEAADHLGLNPRRAKSLIALARYLAYYPDPHHGNIVGLADKATDWHRLQRTTEAKETAERLGESTPTALPPISLPVLPEITFLGTVGEICEEGEKMAHCIASDAEHATKGHCYLFHVEKYGEQATIEIDFVGRLVQAHGPYNRDNRASEWGQRILIRWGKGFHVGETVAPSRKDPDDKAAPPWERYPDDEAEALWDQYPDDETVALWDQQLDDDISFCIT